MKHAVKVISLARSVERRAVFAHHNAHIAYSFFDAADGAQIYPELRMTPELFDADLNYNAGALGCATSHLLLWQEAAATGTTLTILEDDAILRHDFHEQSAAVLAQLDPDWDMVVWGWNFDSILSLNIMPGVSRAVTLFDQNSMRAGAAQFQAMTGTPAALRLDKCFGTPAYTISPAGARKFLRECLPLKNFEVFFPVLNKTVANNGIDIALNRVYSKLATYCSLPPLAITPNDAATSLIQEVQPGARQAVMAAPERPQQQAMRVEAPMAQAGERIPRVVHRIWFGDKPIPEQYERYWAAWQRHLPQFEFRTWREADVAGFRTHGVMATAEGMARKADIARYEILLRHGGIYLDCDIFPLQPFDLDLLRHELVVCNEIEADHYCSIGFIAAAPGNAALQWAVDEVMRRPLNRLPANEDTGPWLFRRALDHASFHRLPVAGFYPYLFNEAFSAMMERDLSGTFGVHVWGGSWFNDQQKLGKLVDRLNRGDLEETANLAAAHSAADPWEVARYCDQARNARRLAVEAARHQLLDNQIEIDNPAPLQFLKAAFSLLSQDPQALVWQFGAADGMQHGAVRGLLVNFDPPAVLVEPNPYLQPLLAENYRNNANVKLVDAALASGAGSLTLHAIDPARVRAAGLPEPVLGLSVPAARSDIAAALSAGNEMGRRIGECFDRVECRTVDVDYLLGLHDGALPAIVAIDGLGSAAEVIRLLMDRGVAPLMLHFGRQGLGSAELNELDALLKGEYVTLGEGEETVAYRTDFFSTYCEHLYVENGIHTIYRKALRFVMNLG